jgi:hypothetical protein
MAPSFTSERSIGRVSEKPAGRRTVRWARRAAAAPLALRTLTAKTADAPARRFRGALTAALSFGGGQTAGWDWGIASRGGEGGATGLAMPLIATAGAHCSPPTSTTWVALSLPGLASGAYFPPPRTATVAVFESGPPSSAAAIRVPT